MDRKGKSLREGSYDITAAYLDHELGKLLRNLKQKGHLENTIIVAMADHGNSWDQSRDKKLVHDLGFRTHYEGIDVPFILVGGKGIPIQTGIHDSMSITRTLWEEVGLPAHESFLGRSVYQPGAPASIVESVGRGNTDVDRRDLYFTVTGETHKVMLLLQGNILTPKRFYDTKNDPQELQNLVEDPSQAPIIEELIAYLFQERAELMERRGVNMAGGANIPLNSDNFANPAL